MTELDIQINATPNPATRMFSKEVTLTNTPFDATELAGSSEALKTLLDCGLQSIFVGHNYLSLTKVDHLEWSNVQPRVLEVIDDVINNFNLVTEKHHKAQMPQDKTFNDPIVEKIHYLLETIVRPAVAHDGGDINFHSFDNGILNVRMSGACNGCPSSPSTLKMGVKNMMQHVIPEVIDVEEVA